MIRTITLDIQMNFTDALQHLLDGKCIGIKPQDNGKYLVKYKPSWINPNCSDYVLCWNRSVKDGKGDETIRSSQYLGTWYLVVADTNSLPDNIKQSFVLENISGLID